jgi:TonB family protein
VALVAVFVASRAFAQGDAPERPAAAGSAPSPAPSPDRAGDGAPNRAPLVPPKPLETPVEYPEGGNGKADVILELTIDADGHVTEVHVVSAVAPFDEAAIRAAKDWVFEPGMRDGHPVATRIRFLLRFEPPEEEVDSNEGGALTTIVTPAGDAGANTAGAAERPPPEAPHRSDAIEVTVRGAREASGTVTVTRSEARELPGTFGDPLRAIEAQPGVIPIISGSPSFFIRGAPPANVGFFIDGVDVPLLYHAFVGPSVIHPGLIESGDLYRGSAPVEYGRFAGPIVEANLQPFAHQWTGEGNLRAIDVGALVEAPFGGCEAGTDDPGCSRGSVRLGGRYSYAGLVLSALSDAQLRYWDYQGQASYALTPRDTVSVFAFGAYDFFQATPDSLDGQGGEFEFHRVDMRYDHRFSAGTSLRFAVTGGYDLTRGTDVTQSEVTDRSLRTRAQLVSEVGSHTTLHSGLDVRLDSYGLRTNPLYLSFPDYSVLFPARTQSVFGAYASADFRLGSGILVSPGVRADVYSSQGTHAVGVDPRVAATFDVSRSVTIEHSIGIAHQQANFAPQVPGAQVADLSGGLQEAWLFSSGVKWKLPESFTASASVFRTAYFHALDPIGGARDFSIDRTVLDRRSTINAAGFELQIARPLTRKVGGFLSYTFSRSEETIGSRRSVSGFDRPHVLQVALSYDFGRGFRGGARAVLYSGIPELNLEGSPHFTDEQRGAPYFRLDGRLEKRWKLGQKSWITAVAEILNATSTREVVRLDCGSVCVQTFAGPVILPSIGVEAGF